MQTNYFKTKEMSEKTEVIENKYFEELYDQDCITGPIKCQNRPNLRTR